MSQTATTITRTGAVQIELPSAHTEVLQGVRWGAIDAFPTPAYFVNQVMARRLTNRPADYRLGQTLVEEVGACLLGGHGIPASVGIAAYQMLRDEGIFDAEKPSFEQLEALLKRPLRVDSRSIHYRFASQKAKYLAQALPIVHAAPKLSTGSELRDWLLYLPGIGLKTASWVARNWLCAEDVAILDIHIVRVGQAINLFPKEFTVERNYLELERLFLEFSAALDVRSSELDAVIWYEMANSPESVRHLIEHLRAPEPRRVRRSRAQLQLALR